jgi:hypothetical protein
MTVAISVQGIVAVVMTPSMSLGSSSIAIVVVSSCCADEHDPLLLLG